MRTTCTRGRSRSHGASSGAKAGTCLWGSGNRIRSTWSSSTWTRRHTCLRPAKCRARPRTPPQTPSPQALVLSGRRSARDGPTARFSSTRVCGTMPVRVPRRATCACGTSRLGSTSMTGAQCSSRSRTSGCMTSRWRRGGRGWPCACGMGACRCGRSSRSRPSRSSGTAPPALRGHTRRASATLSCGVRMGSGSLGAIRGRQSASCSSSLLARSCLCTCATRREWRRWRSKPQAART
mmetsp:Transcript_28712/g.68086  ORF Transcript_28712/g.68086 Transcript_28712/m.68086 type:complete len:237 (+) Transcript_28712:2256-2966(+)